VQYLTRLLREEHRKAGMYLEEDDHCIYLVRGQQVLAEFSALGATKESIQAEADKWL